MSKYRYEMGGIIRDTEIDFPYYTDEIIELLEEKDQQIAELEAKLAESENKLNQYPYKNDVIEKQYEEIKNGIKFRIENNITDDWEQHYHCIDVLCEKHKARIRDIENGICAIEELKQQLANKEKMLERYAEEHLKLYNDYRNLEAEYDKECCNKDQDKISFAVEKLEKVKSRYPRGTTMWSSDDTKDGFEYVSDYIDNQIKEIKGDEVE